MPGMLIVLILITVPFSVLAHPHVFIEAEAELVFEQGVPDSIITRWRFDDFFSRMILLDFAGGSTENLNRENIEAIRKGAFENLSNYNYFFHVLIDGRELTITDIRDFNVLLDGRSMIYEFRIPLRQPGGPGIARLAETGTIVIGIYDKSYFSHVEYSVPPIVFGGEVPPGARADMRERPDRRYYFNLIVPRMIHVEWS